MAPHGYCLLWDPLLIWGSVVSDALIALAYFTIPVVLVRVVRSRPDTGFNWVFWAFATFIVSCGISHLVHIWNLWHGNYQLEVAIKAVTAAVSLLTAASLWPLLPKILAIPSIASLKEANEELLLRIQERDRALERLHDEIKQRTVAQSEAQLLQVSRLTAMGALTSTIAHEINQPLTASANYLAAAAHKTRRLGDEGQAVHSIIAKAQAQSERANEIIRRMRSFAKSGHVTRVPISPSAVLKEALEDLRSRLNRTEVEVQIEAPLDLPCIYADRLHIEQVLTNLLRNAADALRDQPNPQIIMCAKALESELEIRVEDNGPGLSEHQVDEVFHLFSSTKEEGLGLGLPLCRTLVEAHGGAIWAEHSNVGGAAFVIHLPLHSGEQASEHASA